VSSVECRGKGLNTSPYPLPMAKREACDSAFATDFASAIFLISRLQFMQFPRFCKPARNALIRRRFAWLLFYQRARDLFPKGGNAANGALAIWELNILRKGKENVVRRYGGNAGNLPVITSLHRGRIRGAGTNCGRRCFIVSESGFGALFLHGSTVKSERMGAMRSRQHFLKILFPQTETLEAKGSETTT